MSGTPRLATPKRCRGALKLVPVLLFVSVCLNIGQVVYLAVHRPKVYSLYGMYRDMHVLNRVCVFASQLRIWLLAKLPERELTINSRYVTEYSSDQYDHDQRRSLGMSTREYMWATATMLSIAPYVFLSHISIFQPNLMQSTSHCYMH